MASSLASSHRTTESLQPSQTYTCARKADEAAQCLTAYKQSEHRPPTLTCERVFKTPAAVLHVAFTSIPRLNKTDFDMLRASFMYPPYSLQTESPSTPCPRSSSSQFRVSLDENGRQAEYRNMFE
ncbi:hypothetical protein EDB85DRAFT_1973120 [Lactarius pseudohatsudake]|nr:hypothetical protein EDB85DRAFT_1973120 [Lactarius pseudohatsudake]